MRRAGGDDRLYREENQALEDGMMNKVRQLKSLSIDMGSEIKTQNQLLKDMDNDMDRTSDYLRTTMNNLKVKLLRGSGSMQLWFKLFLFVAAVCFVMYFLIRLR